MEEKEYTFTGDLTDLIYDYVEAGDVTANTLQNDILDILAEYNVNCEVNVDNNSYDVVISGLSRDDFETVSQIFDLEMDDLGSHYESLYGTTDFEINDIDSKDLENELANLFESKVSSKLKDYIEKVSDLIIDFFLANPALFDNDILPYCKYRTSKEASKEIVKYFQNLSEDEIIDYFPDYEQSRLIDLIINGQDPDNPLLIDLSEDKEGEN